MDIWAFLIQGWESPNPQQKCRESAGEESREKRALLGGLLVAVPVLCLSKESGLPALLPAVLPAVRFFQALSSQHSPRHFWGFGLSQSCSSPDLPFFGLSVKTPEIAKPGFRNRKPRVFINHPPFPPPKPPSRSLRTLPSLYGKCIGVHSTMERCAGASFGGGGGMSGKLGHHALLSSGNHQKSSKIQGK